MVISKINKDVFDDAQKSLRDFRHEQAVVQVAQMAATCEQVPLNVQNQTINMIAVDCLQQGGNE